MDRINNKISLITGASRGIGAAIALKFAEEGADIVLNYKKSDNAAKNICDKIKATGRNCILAKYDISDEVEATELVKVALDNFGKIDILVNNAGIMLTGEIGSLMIKDLEKMIKTNVYSMVFTIEALIENFKKHGGKIINIASVAGVGTALLNTTYYSITKGAVVTLTKRYAFELGKYNIYVNAIAPGYIETDLTKKGKDEEAWKNIVEQVKSKTILRRIGKPEDIANVALFLASDESNFITGQIIVVDGGRIDYLTHSL